MLNIAICDDDTFFCESIRHFIQTHYQDQISVLEDFSNGYELLHDIETNHTLYHFIFLDIDMPVMNGIDTGLALRRLATHQTSIIFFITCFDAPITSVIDIHPFSYLKKPLDPQILKLKFQTALVQFYNDERCLLLKNKTTIYRLTINNILYISSVGRRSEIHFTDGTTCLIRIRLSEIAKTLLDDRYPFVRSHKSFIANFHHVKKITSTNLYFTENLLIPVSKTYRPAIFSKFQSYCLKQL